jgi:hypothetical protein
MSLALSRLGGSLTINSDQWHASLENEAEMKLYSVMFLQFTTA